MLHARKAWLDGLSPKQNREIPELNYQRVYKLKQEFPDLNIVINGGINSFNDIKHHLKHVDGVMVGRWAYQHPEFLLDVDRLVFDSENSIATSLETVVLRYTRYIENNLQSGVPLKCMARHMLGLYQKIPGARQWRRHLSEHMHKPGAGVDVIYKAHEYVNRICA